MNDGVKTNWKNRYPTVADISTNKTYARCSTTGKGSNVYYGAPRKWLDFDECDLEGLEIPAEDRAEVWEWKTNPLGLKIVTFSKH